MKKFLFEPLVHFLVLGALIFVAYGWVSRDIPEENEIVVTRGQQEHLVHVFTRTWQRPPTAEEFHGLVREYVREEIAYREGVAMGFDEGDTIIRRRMRQKLELLTDEIVSLAGPSEADLQAYLDQNMKDFLVEPHFDLRHVYISRERRGESAATDGGALLEELNANPDADWASMGDPLMLENELEKVQPSDLARQFGADFASEVLAADRNQWTGPIYSGYGLHLVYISNFEPAREPALDEVRQQVTSEWRARQRMDAINELYERLADKYVIEIEEPGEEPGS